MRGFRAALAVLTRLPAGRLEAGDFAAAPGWFAAVGLLIGAVQALALIAAGALWGPWLGALAALAAGILLTGALHEDGLADIADALGARRAPERALEILRDSRIGTYGALALILMLAAQAAALAALGPAAPWALVVAAAFSRALMAVELSRGPYLRAEGAASGMTGAWPLTALLAAAGALAGVAVLGFWGLGIAVAGGAAGAHLAALATAAWARARLGGITGDVLGAVQQAGMLGFLLGVLAWP